MVRDVDVRRVLPMSIGLISGMTIVIGFFAGGPAILSVSSVLARWTSIVAACGFVLGFGVLVLRHARIIWRGDVGWYASIVLLIAAFFVVINGLAPGSRGANDAIVAWTFNYVYVPVGSTLFALLAVYAAIAAYRVLRIGSWNAVALALGALSVLLGRSPVVGQMIPRTADVSGWILAYPVAAALRAVIVGIAVGIVIVGIRVMSGADRRLLR